MNTEKQQRQMPLPLSRNRKAGDMRRERARLSGSSSSLRYRGDVMIEQKSLGKDLRLPIKQSDGTLLTAQQLF